jgi:DDE_Tnp_1-associated
MKLKPKHKLVEHLSKIEAPRIERSQHHKLIDILTIAIVAVICGVEKLGGDGMLWTSQAQVAQVHPRATERDSIA